MLASVPRSGLQKDGILKCIVTPRCSTIGQRYRNVRRRLPVRLIEGLAWEAVSHLGVPYVGVSGMDQGDGIEILSMAMAMKDILEIV